MRRRVIALVAAVLLAGVGTIVLVGFVQSAEERAVAGQELVAVLQVRADATVPQGTKSEDIAQFVEVIQVPLQARAVGAITDLAEVAELATAVDLVPGEQLIAARFVAPEQVEADRREDLPRRRVAVPDGMLEVPVRLDAVSALGGIIDVGDTVAIIASFANYTGSAQGTVTVDDQVVAVPDSTDQAGGGGQATRTLIENALVIEVQADTAPTFADDASGEVVLAPASNFIVTFALEPNDVERLVFATQYGTLYLAQQTPDDVGATGIVTIENIFRD
ncbi:MAG: Flp pilus assembly protein CpaB [Acidimicrobiales bacterium]